jgi:DNA-binding GntR family transcriptional regulator
MRGSGIGLGRESSPSLARAEDAYQTLRLQLLEGPLEAGERIPVVELAARLGCSRVPVMEAVKRLASEGMLTIVPQVGCRVATPDPNEIHDFFTLFAAAEGAITRLAAERRTDADLKALGEACVDVDRMLKGAGGPTARNPVYRRANLHFHGEIHRIARAPSASAIAASLWDRSDFYIKLAFGSLYFSRAVREAHAAIRRAIEKSDPDAAEAAVENHLRTVGARVFRKLAAEG